MAFEPSLTAAGYLQAGLQTVSAIAALGTAGLLLRHRRLVALGERSARLTLAGLIASIGLGCLLSGWQHGVGAPWPLTIGQGGLAAVIAYGLRRLHQQLQSLTVSSRSEQPELPEQDPLTGLPDLPGLMLAYEHIRSYYVGGELEHTLLLIQTDGIRALARAYGSYAGDTALLMLVQALRDKTRTLDVITRVGDHQFAVLLAGCPLAGGLMVAATLRDAIAELQLSTLNGTDALSVSIGAAPFTARTPLDFCLNQAEQALAQAQQIGGSQVAAPPTLPLLPLSVAYEAP